MVEAVASVSSTSSSSPTSIGTSTSITAVPENAWVAARQARITADQERLSRRKTEDEDRPARDREDSDPRHGLATEHRDDFVSDETEQPAVLSGESERIGTANFDEDTPFGERVAIV